MIKQATLTALAAAGLTLGTAAHAALFVAPIDNGSFENGSNPFGSAGNNAEVTDWFEESDDGGNSSEGDTAEVGQIKTANTGNIPQDAVGSYWLNLAGKSTVSNPAVYQQIGTWESNLQVNVTALLGDRSNRGFSGVAFELWRGGTVGSAADGATLASIGATFIASTGLLEPFTEGATPVTGTIDEDLSTGLTGSTSEALWLRIVATGATSTDQNLVDDVVVTPEPGSLALLGLGGLLMLGRGRRSK